jgi:hypothetical protein
MAHPDFVTDDPRVLDEEEAKRLREQARAQAVDPAFEREQEIERIRRRQNIQGRRLHRVAKKQFDAEARRGFQNPRRARELFERAFGRAPSGPGDIAAARAFEARQRAIPGAVKGKGEFLQQGAPGGASTAALPAQRRVAADPAFREMFLDEPGGGRIPRVKSDVGELDPEALNLGEVVQTGESSFVRRDPGGILTPMIWNAASRQFMVDPDADPNQLGPAEREEQYQSIISGIMTLGGVDQSKVPPEVASQLSRIRSSAVELLGSDLSPGIKQEGMRRLWANYSAIRTGLAEEEPSLFDVFTGKAPGQLPPGMEGLEIDSVSLSADGEPQIRLSRPEPEEQMPTFQAAGQERRPFEPFQYDLPSGVKSEPVYFDAKGDLKEVPQPKPQEEEPDTAEALYAENPEQYDSRALTEIQNFFTDNPKAARAAFGVKRFSEVPPSTRRAIAFRIAQQDLSFRTGGAPSLEPAIEQAMFGGTAAPGEGRPPAEGTGAPAVTTSALPIPEQITDVEGGVGFVDRQALNAQVATMSVEELTGTEMNVMKNLEETNPDDVQELQIGPNEEDTITLTRSHLSPHYKVPVYRNENQLHFVLYPKRGLVYPAPVTREEMDLWVQMYMQNGDSRLLYIDPYSGQAVTRELPVFPEEGRGDRQTNMKSSTLRKTSQKR